MDALQVLHNLEDYLGYDLDDDAGDKVIEYVCDDGETDPTYLAELFALQGDRY